MAKIDYDVGDLVVCLPPQGTTLVVGAVYTVLEIYEGFRNRTPGLGVVIAELQPPKPFRGFDAGRFRKLPKKSQEFFTGEMQKVQDLVPAT